MGMQISGKDRVWGLVIAGVMVSFWIWGFQGSRPLVMLGIFPPILFILSLAVPSRYQTRLVTFIVLLMAGVLVGVFLEKLFGNIPFMWWAVCTWPIIAAAVGVWRPFPVLKRFYPFLRRTAERDAGKTGGKEILRRYRPQILSILTFGMGGTIGYGIVYLFDFHRPDGYSGAVVSILIWWIVTAIGVMRFGPFKGYVQKGGEKEGG